MFTQFYNPTLHCFTFQDFLLAPTVEEFAHLLQLLVKNQVPYMIEDNFPNFAEIEKALHMKKNLIEFSFRVKGNTNGLPSKFLFEKATVFANSGSWDAFYAALITHLWSGAIPNRRRNMKKGRTINCCIPLLHKWIMTHLPKRGPFADNVGALKWSQRLVSLDAQDVIWYNHDYMWVELIFHSGEFLSVPLISTKGGLINYNLVLSLRQLGSPLKEKPYD
ncbi:uncharacterized protein LOC127130805 [Lathyrus oleraceus]|uniref:uncharacterized protein LOC127130805 n=1 Tax=Pisum sativum TaxID=3888 RepID=UPI0021CF48FB|nr:uncharacterized protein LOC127130805 [Pisum sativum]